MAALEKLMDASSCLAVDGSLDTKKCLCIPYLAKDGEWEKLAKCDFLIVTDADGGKPRIVLAIEATKMPIACIDVLVELEVKPAGEKEILVTMQ
ncbi:hypothetical protein HDU99_007090, partial [Rhizoclosmatium hyalinum]